MFAIAAVSFFGYAISTNVTSDVVRNGPSQPFTETVYGDLCAVQGAPCSISNSLRYGAECCEGLVCATTDSVLQAERVLGASRGYLSRLYPWDWTLGKNNLATVPANSASVGSCISSLPPPAPPDISSIYVRREEFEEITESIAQAMDTMSAWAKSIGNRLSMQYGAQCEGCWLPGCINCPPPPPPPPPPEPPEPPGLIMTGSSEHSLEQYVMEMGNWISASMVRESMPKKNTPPEALHGILMSNVKYVWYMVQMAIEKALWNTQMRETKAAFRQRHVPRRPHAPMPDNEWQAHVEAMFPELQKMDANFRSSIREAKASYSGKPAPVPSPSPSSHVKPWEEEVIYFHQDAPSSSDKQPAFHLSRDVDAQKEFDYVEPWEEEVIYFHQDAPSSSDKQPAFHLSRDVDAQKEFDYVGLGLGLLKTPPPLEPYRCTPLGIKCSDGLDGPRYSTRSEAEEACDANPICLAFDIAAEGDYPIHLCASFTIRGDKYKEHRVCRRSPYRWETESYEYEYDTYDEYKGLAPPSSVPDILLNKPARLWHEHSYDGTYDDHNTPGAGARGYDYEDTYDDFYAYPYEDGGYDYSYDDGDFYPSEKPWIEAEDYTYDDDGQYKILTGEMPARAKWERYNAADLPSDEEVKKMANENLVNIVSPGSYDSSDHLRPPQKSKL